MGQRGRYGVLIDLGCTWCLISQVVIANLGIWMKDMPRPVRFEQVDGSLLGVAPATHVAEPVSLEMGQHWEVIWFIVVLKMTETIILGLAWLDK